ncbi:MAG: hypothetical protein QNJ16_07925 [Rhodobacter sp.]|nr:hypothetical protein [Rhodobacter sp.]
MAKATTREESKSETADDRLRSLGTALVDSYVEGYARLADAAGRVAGAYADYDPRIGARSPGDVVRQLPETARQAMRELSSGLVSVADAAEGYVEAVADIARPQNLRGGTRKGTDAQILYECRLYLARGRYRGLSLDRLIDKLGEIEDYTKDDLRQLIEKHFVVEDGLVLRSRSSTEKAPLDMPQSVEDHLKALGYTDLREDVELERLDDDKETARLVAYVNDVPAVLVHVCPFGMTRKDYVQDDAGFAAKALSRSQAARYVYITDGVNNAYLDVAADELIDALPAAGT